MQIDIKLVVARYNEDINWTNQIKFPCLIFNKGEFTENEFERLENKGREGDTYLNYVIKYYDDLPDYVLFCQGNPTSNCKDFVNDVNKITTLDENIIFMSDRIVVEDLNGHPNAVGYDMLGMLEKLDIERNMENFTFAAEAQYIVPRRYITSKSKKWWKMCYEKYSDDQRSPWIFERIWPIIFNIERPTY